MISVCVPVYNVEGYIEKCARSIFEQTYQNIEVIFVDDQSQDSSLEILRRVIGEYANRKHNAVVISHEKNLGLAASRNTAVAHANGQFLVHVDSDDWLEPDAIESLVERQKETGADIVSGKAIAHYPDGEVEMCDPYIEDNLSFMRHMAGLTLDHVIWRRLIRTSLYRDNHIEAKEGVNIGEDHHTLPRLIYYANKCVSINKVIYHYNCQNPNSYMSQTDYLEIVRRMDSDLASIDILLDFFSDKDSLCYEQLQQAKVTYLFSYMTKCYENHDRKRYDYVAGTLYSMDSRLLQQAGLYDIKIRSINRFYYLRYLYGKSSHFASIISYGAQS